MVEEACEFRMWRASTVDEIDESETVYSSLFSHTNTKAGIDQFDSMVMSGLLRLLQKALAAYSDAFALDCSDSLPESVIK